MGRRRDAGRFRDFARAALACFLDAGYRLTQIAHVTERMGVSTGLVYRYVESKEALFHVAALEAAGQLPDNPKLPLKVAGVQETVALLRQVVDQDMGWPVLRAALADVPGGDLRAEAVRVAEELYAAVSAHAELILLLDRCSRDIPALAEVFDARLRNRYMDDLANWVIRRRLLRSGSADAAQAVARGVLEAVTWLARNRPRDRTAAQISDAEAAKAAVRIFAGAFDYDLSSPG